MLEYDQHSIEKAYILSYINPSPGNVNQWTQEHYNNFHLLGKKCFIYVVGILLKLPRVIHYMSMYTTMVVLLATALGVSNKIFSSAPYVLLLCIFIILMIYLVSVRASSLDFISVRPSSADTEDDGNGDRFDSELSDDEREEMKREMQRRLTNTRKNDVCICCKETDIHMLHSFNPIKGSVYYYENEHSKICKKCASVVCQNCRKSETQKILKIERGDGCTICVYCVDNVCRKCKTLYNSKEITLRQSQHGRTICKKCKLLETLCKGTDRKNKDNELNLRRILPSPNNNKFTVKSIGLNDIS